MVWLEDIPVASFILSSFGLLVRDLVHGLLTAPSWQTFSLLTCGGGLASERHTITTYLWLTGATTVKHFSRFYVFLGGALYQARWQLWARIMALFQQRNGNSHSFSRKTIIINRLEKI